MHTLIIESDDLVMDGYPDDFVLEKGAEFELRGVPKNSEGQYIDAGWLTGYLAEELRIILKNGEKPVDEPCNIKLVNEDPN